jgi:hypothetical protein
MADFDKWRQQWQWRLQWRWQNGVLQWLSSVASANGVGSGYGGGRRQSLTNEAELAVTIEAANGVGVG